MSDCASINLRKIKKTISRSRYPSLVSVAGTVFFSYLFSLSVFLSFCSFISSYYPFFSANHQVITRHKSKKMHCLSRQCILNIAAGCHFTDPIALRLSLSTETPLNLFFVLYRMLFIKDVYYKYFIIVGTRMFISTGFAT